MMQTESSQYVKDFDSLDFEYHIVLSCLKDFSGQCASQINELKAANKAKLTHSDLWIGLRFSSQIINRNSLQLLLDTAKLAQIYDSALPSQQIDNLLLQIEQLNLHTIPIKSMGKTNKRLYVSSLLTESKNEKLFNRNDIQGTLERFSIVKQKLCQLERFFLDSLNSLFGSQQELGTVNNDKKLRLQLDLNHILVTIDMIENVSCILRFLNDQTSQPLRENLLSQVYLSGSLELRIPNLNSGRVKPKFIEPIFEELERSEYLQNVEECQDKMIPEDQEDFLSCENSISGNSSNCNNYNSQMSMLVNEHNSKQSMISLENNCYEQNFLTETVLASSISTQDSYYGNQYYQYI